eukprot:GFYU01004160.1.p1 GENE.GFYU01004160.1~~GFYU01004160.1.p1  ORF type:complete len:639 (-),score=168.81 GFYU01004160.1:61-1902(-)
MKNLEKLKLLGCGYPSTHDPERFELGITSPPQMFPKFQSLKELDVSHSKVHDDHLSQMLAMMPQLEKLEATHCIELRKPSLVHKRMSYCEFFQCHYISRLYIDLPQIDILKVNHCDHLLAIDVAEVKDRSVLRGASKIEIEGSQVNPAGIVDFLALHEKTIQSMCFSFCLHMDEFASRQFSMPKLKYIYMERAAVTDAFITALAGPQSIVEIVEIGECPNIKAPAILSPCLQRVDVHATEMDRACIDRMISAASTTLEELILYECDNLTGVKLECENLKLLQANRCPKLSAIDICTGQYPCIENIELDESLVDHSVVNGLLERCPNLEKVSLSNCDEIARISLTHANLKKFRMRDCSGVRALELECPQLEWIDIDGCSALREVKIDSAALTKVHLFSLNHLTDLVFGDNSSSTITDLVIHNSALKSVTLNNLVNDLFKLQNLSLAVCESLNTIEFTNASLIDLSVDLCPSVTRLRLECPGLRKLLLAAVAVKQSNVITAVNNDLLSLEELNLIDMGSLGEFKVVSDTLQRVCFQRCNYLEKAMFECPNIKNVRVTNCKRFADASCVTFRQQREEPIVVHSDFTWQDEEERLFAEMSGAQGDPADCKPSMCVTM